MAVSDSPGRGSRNRSGACAAQSLLQAGFAFAFEHLEIAAYKLLKRVAARAGDVETISIAEKILLQERNAAGRIHSLFDDALDASLQEAEVAA